ncbi:hypothetical protein N7468_006841 [Penicillium chermesinum]|uniref:C3H1-type domain-containing protein n=1 Tax=Penicillium chermesinum TaxID=63820 RepID=A0A9W9NT02_9EURO|nr:uncharacterized protein N7468_006841 [Penicillium chermesinum]KAJ5225616.1 hypothetical protein N7468_006841 [Penicillium chermesinum]
MERSVDSPAGPDPQVHRPEQPPMGDELSTQSSSQGVTSTRETKAARQSAPKKKARCRYFGTKKGCRAGAECPFVHDDPGTTSSADHSPSNSSTSTAQDVASRVATGVQSLSLSDRTSKQATKAPQVAQIQRPVSKVEKNDPREFQINQLRRRFRPEETADDNGTILSFGMAPSDPDFPFELDSLQCVLHVPRLYPETGRGFDDIVDFALRTNGRGTLLSWLNSLDRQLEKLLTSLDRGPKLTFVANAGNPGPARQPAAIGKQTQTQVVTPQAMAAAPQATVATPSPQPLVRQPIFTTEQKAQAEKRRSTETKQLEARLGRLPLFQKRSEGSFIIPIQPAKQDRLPKSLQTLKTVKLSIPLLYPLHQSYIEIQGIDSPEARSVETGFAQWVERNSQLNLVSQINYLASNLHNFAKTPLPEIAEHSQHEHTMPPAHDTPLPEPESSKSADVNQDKPHLHVIPRPPEWSLPEQSESEVTDESSYHTSEEEPSDEESVEGGAPVPAILDTPGRGVALSFPFMELYGIELLEVLFLAVTIKCERCKESTDIKNVPQITEQSQTLKIESCRKCANAMSIGFRKQLMHSHANRAGYLDLGGCIVVTDLVNSNFLPTCSECSTPYPSPGVSSVRGESTMAICRHCHRKMGKLYMPYSNTTEQLIEPCLVFKLPEVKFLVVDNATERPSELSPVKNFHDVVAANTTERAIVGSDLVVVPKFSHAIKQIYRPEGCGICKATLVGKAGSGFWEGGKGTRNRALMSRKDPRKYKRRGGTVPGGSSSSKRK